MAVIDTKDLVGVRIDDAIDRGLYTLRITDAKSWKKEGGFNNIILNLMVIEAPEQQDGSDPVGITFSDFIQTEGMETHKDGGRYAKRLYARFLAAVNIEPGESYDPEDLKDMEVLAMLKTGKGRDGLPAPEVQSYIPQDDGTSEAPKTAKSKKSEEGSDPY